MTACCVCVCVQRRDAVVISMGLSDTLTVITELNLLPMATQHPPKFKNRKKLSYEIRRDRIKGHSKDKEEPFPESMLLPVISGSCGMKN